MSQIVIVRLKMVTSLFVCNVLACSWRSVGCGAKWESGRRYGEREGVGESLLSSPIPPPPAVFLLISLWIILNTNKQNHYSWRCIWQTWIFSGFFFLQLHKLHLQLQWSSLHWYILWVGYGKLSWVWEYA